MINKPASEKMRIIHDTKRPMITDYINELFTDFTELHGDRYFRTTMPSSAALATSTAHR